MTFYGAIFQKKELDSSIDDMELLDKLYNNKAADSNLLLFEKLHKLDKRFEVKRLEKTQVYYYIGMYVLQMNNNETMAQFRNKIQETMQAVFNKKIECGFFEIKEED